MYAPSYWDAHPMRYGKRMAVRIPSYIVRDYVILPGSVVRVRLIGVPVPVEKLTPEGSRIIRYNSMEPQHSTNEPVLDGDGVTWTANVLVVGALTIRIPSELVVKRYIVPGSVVRLSFVEIITKPSDHIQKFDGRIVFPDPDNPMGPFGMLPNRP